LRGHAAKSSEFKDQVTLRKAERERGLEPTRPVLICQCGCGKRIPWKANHATRPPRFIQAHYLRDGTSQRIVKLREAKAKLRMSPPDDWSRPSGLCECGCGQATRISKCSRPERNEYMGHPQRFIRGHHTRHMTRERSHRWNGGRIADQAGYVLVHRPDHPTARKDGYVFEHRLVYEMTHNVSLPRHVLVHHINGNKTDNRPANLVATTRKKHIDVHSKAGAIISVFYDSALYERCRAYVLQHGELPDVAEMIASTT
jgi:hypothetical protein